MNNEWPYDELPPDFLDWLRDMHNEPTYTHAMTGVPQKPFQRGQIIYSDDLHDIQNVKFGRIDKDGKFVELTAPIPARINHWDFGTGEARLDSGLYRLQDIVNQSNVGFTVSSPLDEEALEVLTGELRQIQEWRKQLLEQIRLWVKTVHEGDLQPLISVLRFGAKHLPPEQLTTKYLEQKFLQTTDMWFALEKSLMERPADIGAACQHILYLMMLKGEDNGSLSPDV